jgi:predicted DNA-binding transcriptional regulator AlpA
MASRTNRTEVGKPRPILTRSDQIDAVTPELMMAARLSKRLGISAVTLWRWRHDKDLGFPKATVINHHSFFDWREVAAWLARLQRTA